MLRVTVTREDATDSVQIAEMVIGKFAGSEQRGAYVARVLEPPSRYSNGIDACFAVRSHDRFQPALALVAAVLEAWRTGRTDKVGSGVAAILENTSRLVETRAAAESEDATGAPLASAPEAEEDGGLPAEESVTAQAARLIRERAGDPAIDALARAIIAVAGR